jgi:hypothetical protein
MQSPSGQCFIEASIKALHLQIEKSQSKELIKAAEPMSGSGHS